MAKTSGLTDKQQRFVDEYLVDLNASAAARRAGYSEKTAGHIAKQLVTKTSIAQAIAEKMQDLQQRTEITQEYVLSRLKEIVERTTQHEGADEYDPRAAVKALELLGKHLGLYTEKVSLKGEITVASILQELEQYERHKTAE